MLHTNIDKLNQEHWDELATVHLKSYDLKKLFEGKSLMNDMEKKEIGGLRNKKVLHLQCHIGKETISMALEGANVTAVDYSLKSIKVAKELASAIGVNIRFIHSNIYDLLKVLDSEFDIIYASKGVLQWLPDLDKWANIIAALLSKNGFFYIQEIHPNKYILDDVLNSSRFDNQKPLRIRNQDYSDKSYHPKNAAFEYRWSLYEIIKSISNAGMKIEFLNEIDKLFYNGLPNMIKDNDCWWKVNNKTKEIPLTFSIKAQKSAHTAKHICNSHEPTLNPKIAKELVCLPTLFCRPQKLIFSETTVLRMD